MMVIRSFDVNIPGTEVNRLIGGVAGGTLKRGILKLHQQIEIRPGLIIEKKNGVIICKPLLTEVKSLFSEKNPMKMAVPGGLIAVGTLLDPTLTMGDRLVGQIIGIPGHMPEVYRHLEIRFFLMNRLIGMKGEATEKPVRVKKLIQDEILMVNIGSLSTHGKVIAVKRDVAKIFFKKPCCVEMGEQISLSRSIGGGNRLIGCAQVLHGDPLPLDYSGGSMRDILVAKSDTIVEE